MRPIVFEFGLQAREKRFTTFGDRGLHVMGFDIAQNSGLDSAIGKIKAWAMISPPGISIVAIPVLELRRRNLHGMSIAMSEKLIDDGSARISEPQQLRNFIESFPGSVVAG